MTDTIFPDLNRFHPGDVPAIRQKTDVCATEIAYGTVIDPWTSSQVNAFRRCEFTVAFYYLFLKTTSTPQTQAQACINLMGNLQPNEFMVVDYEFDGTMPTLIARDTAAEIFEQRYQKPTVIYEDLANEIASPVDRPVWVADYGQAEPTRPHLFWQYSDAVAWPGAGNCDSNIYHGSGLDLLRALTGQGQPIESDNDMSEALTITYANGHKTIGNAAGGVYNAGTPFFGAAGNLHPDESEDYGSVFALTAVTKTDSDGNQVPDETLGYTQWVIGAKSGQVHQFTYNEAFKASHGL
jgi:Glycosyl hydrolases family 25